MKATILVNVVRDHTFECDTNIIGRSGEGGVTQFQITIPDGLRDCSVYLDFEMPNGDTFRSKKLRIIDNVATYDVPVYLLKESGEIKVQLVAKTENDEVWKSSIKRYVNLGSINGVEKIPVVPVGKIEITNTAEIDVKQFATAQVVDEDLIAQNIVKGVSILGVTGTHDCDDFTELQEKTITVNGEYTPDSGFDGFGKVIVNVADIPAVVQEKTKTIEANGTYEIAPDGGFDGLSKVKVTIDVEKGYTITESEDGTVLDIVYADADMITLSLSLVNETVNAEANMTWAEWCESSYSEGLTYKGDGSELSFHVSGSAIIWSSDYADGTIEGVNSTDVIVANKAYTMTEE